MRRREAAPVLVDRLKGFTASSRLSRLAREFVSGQKPAYDEALIRDVIDRCPGLLPTHEVDLGFKDMQPVCVELPVRTRHQPNRAGYIDNLLINRDGKVCLVECKLWRNAEAARKVVAQILDYAAGLSTWSYKELREAVATRYPKEVGDSIAARVLGAKTTDDERDEFAQAVEASLRRGNFLLLIAGDGIRPEVREMARLLEGQPMLSFVLALVELEIYAAEGGQAPYYVQPRMLLPEGMPLRPSEPITPLQLSEALGTIPPEEKARPTTDEEFYQRLGTANPTFPDRLQAFLKACHAAGCRPELLRKYVLYVDVPGNRPINAGTIDRAGKVTFWGQASRDDQLPEPLGRNYMERVVRLLPGAVVNDESTDRGAWHIRYQGSSELPLGLLLDQEAEWLAAIRDLTSGLAAFGNQS